LPEKVDFLVKTILLLLIWHVNLTGQWIDIIDVHVEVISTEETGKLIEFRLRQAGYVGDRSLLTHEAVRKVYEYTQGYPRQIALICHNAMEYLIMGDHEIVTADLIDKIIDQEKLWK